MILSKAGKLSLLAGLLCLLLMGFAGASYGAVRFDVVPSPTEVINTGRSEVLGSINLIVASSGTTGTAAGGVSQIGIIYQNGVQIDNNTTSGIRIFTDFATPPTVLSVQNLSITGRCTGFITINIAPGVAVVPNQYIRLEGVRGRVDLSDGLTAGTDLGAQLQSINDPAANSFFPETIRVAKSLPGLTVSVTADNVLLCFPSYGVAPGSSNTYPAYMITLTEGFVRAFVARDSNSANVDATDRADSGSFLLGSPNNSTRVQVVLNSIPFSVSSIEWETTVNNYLSSGTSWSWLALISSSFTAGSAGNPTGLALGVYDYQTNNQVGQSDIALETFRLTPKVVLKTDNQVDTGNVLAAASLWPAADSPTGCTSPSSDSTARPRFQTNYISGAITSTSNLDTRFGVYATLVRCNCFLLFTYMMKDSFWDTGIAIANTTGDTQVFGTRGAPKQSGRVFFNFYDKTNAFVGTQKAINPDGTDMIITPGKSFVGLLSQVLPTTVASFQGYVIVQTEFQYCHGYAFIADKNFANIAQGYLGNVIPDPLIKPGGSSSFRQPSAAGDVSLGGRGLPAGESLNN
jgi:hypothetical protein